MDVYKTHGAFSWNELVTPDPKAAVAFYTQLFGWNVKTMNMGQEYHVVQVGEQAVGGVMATPPDAQGMPPMWGSYVTVANVDETVAQCQQLGGKVLVPVMDVPTVGRMAVLQDPQGACFSVMTYAG